MMRTPLAAEPMGTGVEHLLVEPGNLVDGVVVVEPDFLLSPFFEPYAPLTR